MKLVFDNTWMNLRAKSMGKLHTITHVVTSNERHTRLFNDKDLINVSGLPKATLLDDIKLMAPMYSATTKTKLKCLSTRERPFTNLYIAADGQHFQVAYVALTPAMGNAFMKDRDDIALICSSEATDQAPELHFLASIAPV
jgi:hypothetical protein